MSEISNRAKCGYARAAALTEQQRKDISTKAAQARWGLKATHKGSFKQDFGIDVECYVLNDEHKTAVISQIGMGITLGMSPRASAFPRFIESKVMTETLSAALREKLAQPVKFQWSNHSAASPYSTVVHGFDVTILIDVCKAIIEADDQAKFQPSQAHVAKQARIIISSCAKAGIQNLVYKLAGYDATQEEVVSAFKIFLREEAREYEKEFPDELYKQWYRIYQLTPPEKGHNWKFRHLTENHIYKTLAKSSGKILELTQEQRMVGNESSKKLHQFLSEVGLKSLRGHIREIIGIAKVSRTKQEYENNIDFVYGDQLKLDLQP